MMLGLHLGLRLIFLLICLLCGKQIQPPAEAFSITKQEASENKQPSFYSLQINAKCFNGPAAC